MNYRPFIQKAIISAGMLLSSGYAAMAQEATETVPFAAKYSEELIYLLIAIVFLVVMGVILALTNMLIKEVNQVHLELRKARGLVEEDEKPEPDIFDKLMGSMTDVVPIEEEEEILFDHEYDGIRELDNNLPPWWQMLFYGCIIWSIGYLGYYHVLGYGQLSAEEYATEMKEAEIQKAEYLKRMANMVNESNVVALVDEVDIKKGMDIYFTHCVQCHGEYGQGLVGPNFTDDYWKHGGSIQNVFSTIKYGVPSKGMISWQAQLKPRQIQEVASYILTLRGTNPPNAKEPEGELYVPEGDEPAAETDSLSLDELIEAADSIEAAETDSTEGG